MIPSRQHIITSILIKYAFFMNALERVQNRSLSSSNFTRWFTGFIKLKDNNLIHMPVCRHEFAENFTHIITYTRKLQKLKKYAYIFNKHNFMTLGEYIRSNPTLSLRFVHIHLFLLLLSDHELNYLGFVTMRIEE